MTGEKLEFSRRLLIGGNLGLLGWLLSAFIAVFMYNQLLGYFYLILEAFTIYAILRRLGCSSCYKCKTCTSGFGRLAGAFFGKGAVRKESVGNRFGLIVFVYCLLIVIPVPLLLFRLWQAFSPMAIIVFGLILTLTVYSITSVWSR